MPLSSTWLSVQELDFFIDVKGSSMRWQTALRIFWNADESKAEEYFHYTEEMGKAYKSNNLPKDITDEIEKLKKNSKVKFYLRRKR